VRVSPSPVTVLLVEDHLDDLILAQRAFKKAGIKATLVVCRDGEQAIQYLAGTGAFADRQRSPFPSLVLLDWKLPQRSGHEVLQWIRAQSALDCLPVVVCSSSKEPEDVSRAYQAAANGYLEKPLEPRSLLELLDRFDLKREEA